MTSFFFTSKQQNQKYQSSLSNRFLLQQVVSANNKSKCQTSDMFQQYSHMFSVRLKLWYKQEITLLQFIGMTLLTLLGHVAHPMLYSGICLTSSPQQKFVRCSVRAEVRHLRKVLCHRLNVEKHQVSRQSSLTR